MRDQYQFGFKKGHSTLQYVNVFKQNFDYYQSRGSHLFSCFLDAAKIYDRVNYWKIIFEINTVGFSIIHC